MTRNLAIIRIISFAGIGLITLCVSCNEPATENAIETTVLSTPDWTDASHGNKVDPDYGLVFPQESVNTLEIILGNDNWGTIQTNMQALFGFAFGAAGGQNQGPLPANEPDYVATSVKFNGKEWYKVGFRLKGNSTLRNSWRAGIYKLPFRLNFDRYEDDFPEIVNQRLYGFKELSMSPGANDNSLIREKAGSDIFRMAGIPCSQTAFYKVYIDFGTGLTYCGVYTMVELVDDTMLKNQLGSKSGNIYKPESNFKNFIATQFEKKNNETANDFSDVQSVIATLNSPTRISNPAEWRTNFEKSFNVDQFLKWLAINTTMLNWDTYGRMAHNYYLYNDPINNLTWIPWDNNESMMNRGAVTTSISLSMVTSDWPLIRYLMDDPVYLAQYKVHVEAFVNSVFTIHEMETLLTKYHDLISPYVIGPQAVETGKYSHLTNAAAFDSELSALKQHIISQNTKAADFLK